MKTSLLWFNFTSRPNSSVVICRSWLVDSSSLVMENRSLTRLSLAQSLTTISTTRCIILAYDHSELGKNIFIFDFVHRPKISTATTHGNYSNMANADVPDDIYSIIVESTRSDKEKIPVRLNQEQANEYNNTIISIENARSTLTLPEGVSLANEPISIGVSNRPQRFWVDFTLANVDRFELYPPAPVPGDGNVIWELLLPDPPGLHGPEAPLATDCLTRKDKIMGAIISRIPFLPRPSPPSFLPAALFTQPAPGGRRHSSYSGTKFDSESLERPSRHRNNSFYSTRSPKNLEDSPIRSPRLVSSNLQSKISADARNARQELKEREAEAIEFYGRTDVTEEEVDDMPLKTVERRLLTILDIARKLSRYQIWHRLTGCLIIPKAYTPMAASLEWLCASRIFSKYKSMCARAGFYDSASKTLNGALFHYSDDFELTPPPRGLELDFLRLFKPDKKGKQRRQSSGGFRRNAIPGDVGAAAAATAAENDGVPSTDPEMTEERIAKIIAYHRGLSVYQQLPWQVCNDRRIIGLNDGDISPRAVVSHSGIFVATSPRICT